MPRSSNYSRAVEAVRAGTARLGVRSANNEFIGACIEFDQLLAHLQTMRADHFGVDPDGQRNWAEVGSVKHAVERLREVTEFLAGTTP